MVTKVRDPHEGWDPFFWAAWWEATEDMTCVARGAYISMLAQCYLHGSVTASMRKLSGICAVDSKTMERLWNNGAHPLKNKFIVGSDGRLRSKKQITLKPPSRAMDHPRDLDLLEKKPTDIQTLPTGDDNSFQPPKGPTGDVLEQLAYLPPFLLGEVKANAAIARLGLTVEDLEAWRKSGFPEKKLIWGVQRFKRPEGLKSRDERLRSEKLEDPSLGDDVEERRLKVLRKRDADLRAQKAAEKAEAVPPPPELLEVLKKIGKPVVF